jgi:RHH-type transcriptional regulator, rel operon repressor / antitoxin RelB
MSCMARRPTETTWGWVKCWSGPFLGAEAINAYLEVNEWQVAGIKKAIASIDANGGVDHADVKAWVAS